MKKSRIVNLVVVLALMLAMYNCKKKEEPFPLEPDTEVKKELDAIVVAPVTPTAPAPVTSTPATVTVSAPAAAVAGDMAQLKSGTVPASVQTAATQVSAVVSPAEVTTLTGVTPATIAAVAAGGALPANLKTIIDKVAANPALAAYLPKLTFPAVNGVTVSGGRSGAIEEVEKTEGVLVEDACVQAAAAAFEVVKTRLDATRAAELAKIAAAFSGAIAPLAAEEASCVAGVPAKYAAFRTAGQAQATQALADLDAAKDVIPASLYPVLKAFINIQLLGYLSSINTLQAADVKACNEITKAKTAAITAARNADITKANANYTEALALAQTKKAELTQTCHNQGGGN